MINKLEVVNSFGVYPQPVQKIDLWLNNNRLLKMVNKIAIGCLFALSACALCGVISFSLAGPAIVIMSAIPIGYLFLRLYNYMKICKNAGLILKPENLKTHGFDLAEGIRCRGIPSQHCADTELWRAQLVSAAEHNIVLSGNYCGGDSFIKFLELVEKKLIEKPGLKVIVISSPKFLKGVCRKKVQAFTKKHSQNFSLVESDDIFHVSPGIKKTTNHTKCMVIDYGKYFILGGSGIKDNFADTGLDTVTKESFLKEALGMHREFFNLRSSSSLLEDQGEENKWLGNGSLGMTTHLENWVIKKIMPGNFRDMDFIFRAESRENGYSEGSRLYIQMLLLAYRWEKYVEAVKSRSKVRQLSELDLGVMHGKAGRINEKDSLTTQLLKTPMPCGREIKTKVHALDKKCRQVAEMALQIFSSGPEQNGSIFEAHIVEKVQQAQEGIWINHMYFHPTKDILNALVKAAQRGVKIKIITNGIYTGSPSSHKIFGPRNKYNYKWLVDSLDSEYKKNVEIYEFEQEKKGLHKKVIVIDGCVIGGSSNLGYKSLVTTSDHEINFSVTSEGFRNSVLEVFEVDIAHSRRVDDPIILSGRDYIKTVIHRVMAPLIG